MAYLSRNADFLAEKVVMSPGALSSYRVNVDITAALRNDFYTTDWLQVLHPGYLNANRNIGVYRGQKVVNANIDAFNLYKLTKWDVRICNIQVKFS